MPTMDHAVALTVKRLVTAAAVLTMLAGAGGANGSPTAGPPRYHGSFLVLESPRHGPQLCVSWRDSLPPQCGGLPVRNWDWAAVEGAESMGGTTWGRWHVAGTFTGDALVLTEVPGPPEPERRPDREPAGPLPPVAAETERALARVQEDLRADEARAALGTVPYSYTDPQRNVVVAAVWLADGSAERFAKSRWGDRVELRSLLRPLR